MGDTNKKKEDENMGIKEDCDRMTEIIESCWDSNQELDENGKPIDNLTFDERLNKKLSELKGQDKVLMNEILRGV